MSGLQLNDGRFSLLQLYLQHQSQIRRMLSLLSPDVPAYHNLEWRLDVQVCVCVCVSLLKTRLVEKPSCQVTMCVFVQSCWPHVILMNDFLLRFSILGGHLPASVNVWGYYYNIDALLIQT